MRLIDADAFMKRVARFTIENPDELSLSDAKKFLLMIRAEAELYEVDADDYANEEENHFRA